MDFKDYYKVLEVNRDTSDEVIKMAYKALVKKHHPDLNKDNIETSNLKIKEINEAYRILGNLQNRQIYNNEYDKYKSREKEHSSYYSYAQNNTMNNNTTNNEKWSKKYSNKISIKQKVTMVSLVIASFFIFFIGFDKGIYPLVGFISSILFLAFKMNKRVSFNYIFIFIIILLFISLTINIDKHSGYLYLNDSYKFFYYFN